MRFVRAFGLSAMVLTLVACDDTTVDATGEFELNIAEIQDSCDGQLNQFASRIEITETGDGVFTVDFGGEAELTGEFDDNGFLQVSGVIDDQGGDNITFMRMQLAPALEFIEGSGRIEYNNTFPEVEGFCQQEFVVSEGRRAENLSPIL